MSPELEKKIAERFREAAKLYFGALRVVDTILPVVEDRLSFADLYDSLEYTVWNKVNHYREIDQLADKEILEELLDLEPPLARKTKKRKEQPRPNPQYTQSRIIIGGPDDDDGPRGFAEPEPQPKGEVNVAVD